MKETTSKLKQAHAFYLAREYMYISEYGTLTAINIYSVVLGKFWVSFLIPDLCTLTNFYNFFFHWNSLAFQ